MPQLSPPCPAQAAAGALEKMAESDYLRLDSLLLTCQLHVRGLLQARPRHTPDQNTTVKKRLSIVPCQLTGRSLCSCSACA